MQGGPALGLGVAAPGGLAVDGDEVGLGLAQAVDPGGEAGLEEVGVERVDDVVQGVVRRQAPRIGQETTQEAQALLAPQPDLDEIVHAAQRGAQDQQQDLRKRVDHPPLLARILQGGEVLEDRQR